MKATIYGGIFFSVFLLCVLKVGVVFGGEGGFAPSVRMAAWHETMVRLDEVVPNAAVLTYDTDTVKSFFVSKMVAYPGGAPTDAQELAVEDFPGGVEAKYKLAGAEVKATLVPLIVGRDTPAKDGAALYRLEAPTRKSIVVECGPGAHASNFAVAAFSDGSLMRGMDFQYVKGEVKFAVEGNFAFMTDPQLPFITAIWTQGKISIEEDSGKGGFVRIKSDGGNLDIVVAYGPDVESIKKLIPADGNEGFAAVKGYYEKLLESRIETPEKVMDQAFRSAIYNLEYNYLAPYGWIECLGHWHAVWHQQHTRGAEWLGQTERSRKCIMEQAKLIFEDNQIPNIQPDGKGFKTFGGTNQYFMWEVRMYLRFTNDVKFARAIAPLLDRVLRGTLDREDPDGNMLFAWGLQIGNQEDFVATPHDGTAPTIEVINMMKTRAEVADVLGDEKTASLWRSRAALAQGNLRDTLWMKDLGRFGYFVDPQGTLRPDGVGDDGEVYCSNNFPEHYSGSWGMQAGCAQQPWGAWAFSKVGLRNEAYRPLKATAEWVMNDALRGSWPEVDGGHSPSYFSPPAGLYIASMVEAVFGLKPDLPHKILEISPAFPDHWPEAKLVLPQHSAVYHRKGNRIRYEVSTSGKTARAIRWKLPPCTIKSFKIDGEKADYKIQGGVGHVELVARAPAAQKTVIEFEFSEVNFRFDYPRSIAEGDEFEVEGAGAGIDRVIDRAGVFSSTRFHDSGFRSRVSENLLDGYLKYGPLGELNFARRSVFLECTAPGGVRFIQPLDFAVLPRYEARLDDGKVTVRNNTQSRLAGGSSLFVGGLPYGFEVDVAARSEQSFAVEFPAKTLSPGENMARLVLPDFQVIELSFLMDDVEVQDDVLVPLTLETRLLMADTDWPSLRVFQGQPHVFVAWAEWNQPLKSLEGKDALAVPEIPGLEFAINQRKFIPVSRRIDKPSYRHRLAKAEYKKFYLLLLPLVDNHDMFTEVARVNIYNGKKRVGGKVLTYPGDLDYINPMPQPVGGTYRGARDRHALLPLLDGKSGDWEEGKAPAFSQPEYWSSSLPVALDSGILTVVEIDLGEAHEADSIVFELQGEYAAFGILGIVAEKFNDPSMRTVFEFESSADLDGWKLKGNAFSVAAVPRLFDTVTLNSLAKAGEPAVGKAVSPVFRIGEGDQSLLIEYHGGKSENADGHPSLSIRLVDARSGKVLEEFPASGSHVPGQMKIPLKGLGNRAVRIEVLDIDKRAAYAWIGLKSVRIKSNK